VGNATLVYDRLYGKVLKTKKNLHGWNEYESYAIDPQNIDKELGRLDGTNLAWDPVSRPTPTPEQLKMAWKLFKEEHGDKTKTMMEMCAMVKDIVTTQTQGERKRDYLSVQKQLVDLINWVYNRYNIHIWALIAGGLSRSNQLFSTLCELNASKGFSKILGLEPEDANVLFQAFIYYQNALKVTNQQFAAMGTQRGLKVTGPGVDEELPVTSLPTTLLPPPGSQAATPRKTKKEDVRAVVKARTDECLAVLDRSFTRKILPWNTLAIECVDIGLQVINYPLGTMYPWEDMERLGKAPKAAGKKLTNRGIKNLPPAHQLKLIDACRADNEYRLSLVLADSIRLEAGDLPVFVSVPDSTGKVTKTFAKDIPGCLEAVKALRGTQDKKVKFEEPEADLLMNATSSTRPSHARDAKNKPKPSYGLQADSEDEEDELTAESTSYSGEVEVTPQPKRKALTKKGSGSRFKGDELKHRERTTSKAPSRSTDPPQPGSDAPNPTTPKRSLSSKVISAAEFDQGGFQEGGFGTLKRGASDVRAHEGPAGKRLKQTDASETTSEMVRPSSTSSHPAAAPDMMSTVQLPRPPQNPPPPHAFSGNGSSSATPPPSLHPAFPWQYPPAMYGMPGMPPPHLHAPPPMNMSPEMMNAMLPMFHAYMAQQQQPQPGPSSGYQHPSAGPGK
ncbi:hypothetical protein PQX77_013581, partial [Marasmius sp. AFHP31]